MEYINLFLLLVLLYLLCNDSKEGFIFTNEEIEKRVKIIKKNESLFHPGGKYSDAATKKELCWLDPILYYDLTKLSYNNTFNENNIRKLFK